MKQPLKEIFLYNILPFLVLGAALVSLGGWLFHDPSADFEIARPGMDGSPLKTRRLQGSGEFQTYAQKYNGLPGNPEANWPGFRGPGRNNVSPETFPLKSRWKDDGPELLWSQELGEGHAAPSVKNGLVYLLDYDEEKKCDALRAFSLDTGEEVWRRWYAAGLKRNHGFSRTVPAVTEKYVLSIGPDCHVMAVDALSGSLLWVKYLPEIYGTKTPFWYTGQCPLIDGEVGILAPGGEEVLLAGVDMLTGEVLWEAPNPGGWQMSHSSVMLMETEGRKMYIYAAVGGIAGVSTEGELLWQTSEWVHSVVAPSPVTFPDGRFFITAGYGGGSAMFQVYSYLGGWDVQLLYSYGPDGGLACEQQTPVLYEGYLYGILPKDAGTLRNQFICYDPGGEVLWSSGEQFGLGPFIEAGGKFYILNDDGRLTVVEATPEEYRVLGKAKVLDGNDAWGPVAITGGRMLLRDSRTLRCYNIREE